MPGIHRAHSSVRVRLYKVTDVLQQLQPRAVGEVVRADADKQAGQRVAELGHVSFADARSPLGHRC